MTSIFLPKVSMILCEDQELCYSFQDIDGGKQINIIDHPLVSKDTRELDRALFRKFLGANRGSIAICGPQVIADIAGLANVFALKVDNLKSPEEHFKDALLEERNIILLGGRRVYDVFLKLNLVDELIIHELDGVLPKLTGKGTYQNRYAFTCDSEPSFFNTTPRIINFQNSRLKIHTRGR